MASHGGSGLLPIPRRARQHGTVARLPAARVPVVAGRSGSSQSTRAGGLGPSQPAAGSVDSSTPRSASLSRRALRRQVSSVRAVCVNALVRICAGGDQRWSSLPRQLCRRRANRLEAIYEIGSSLLIENASGLIFSPSGNYLPEAFPIKARDGTGVDGDKPVSGLRDEALKVSGITSHCRKCGCSNGSNRQKPVFQSGDCRSHLGGLPPL